MECISTVKLSPCSAGAPTEVKGVEDPRLTVLDGRIHMLYTAWSPDAIQVSHASTTDFKHWDRHGIVFPGPDNKDAALFPRKINGRYVAFHRIPRPCGLHGRMIW